MIQSISEQRMTFGELGGIAMLLVLFSFPWLTAFNPTNFGIVLTVGMFGVSLLYLTATSVTPQMTLTVCLIALAVLVCSVFFAGSLIRGVEDFLKFFFFYVLCERRRELFGGKGLRSISLLLLSITLVANLGFAVVGTLYASSDSGEFIGIFGSVNLTSYILVLSALYLALWMQKRGHLLSVLFLLGVVVAMLWFTGTRSLVFFLPFMICYAFKWDPRATSVKLLVPIGVLGAIAIGFVLVNVELLATVASIVEDESYTTRLELYSRILSELRTRLAIVPGGIGWSESIMEREFNSYPVHNDILKYLLDYGAFFYFIFWITLFKICFFSASMQKTLLGLFYLSAALHNNLYSPFLIVPYILCQQYLRKESRDKLGRSGHLDLQ